MMHFGRKKVDTKEGKMVYPTQRKFNEIYHKFNVTHVTYQIDFCDAQVPPYRQGINR